MKHLCFFLLFLLPLTLTQAQSNPVAYAGPDQDICNGDTVQLMGTGTGAGPNYTYQWSPATWISDPTIANPLVWPPTDTEYTLVVTSNGFNSPPDTAEVRSHPIPTVDGGPAQDICLGDTVQLDGTASGDPSAVYQYNWSPGNTLSDSTLEDPQAYPIQTSTYFVVARSLWGCESGLDSVTVFIRPTALAEAGMDQVVCIGDSFLLQGSYFWATGDSLPASSVFASWTPVSLLVDSSAFNTQGLADSSRWYYLQVNSGICSRIDSVRVTAFPQPMPVILQSGNTLLANGGLGGGSYQWFRNNAPLVGAISPTYQVTQPGCYSVEVSEGACSGVSDTLCIQSVGMTEANNLQALRVFPNPFQNKIHLEIDLLRGDVLSIELMGLDGRIILQQAERRLPAGKQILEFQVPELPAGTYWLRISGKSSSRVIPLSHFEND